MKIKEIKFIKKQRRHTKILHTYLMTDRLTDKYKANMFGVVLLFS